MSDKTTLYLKVEPEPLFDRFLEHYRREGFHVEEADRVEFTINLANDSALGFLFGLGKKRIFADFDPTDDGCRVRLSVRGGEAFMRQVAVVLEEEANALIALKMKRASKSGPPAQPQPQVIIVKETVRIPCAYCGELMDNTASKCPNCGAGLR